MGSWILRSLASLLVRQDWNLCSAVGCGGEFSFLEGQALVCAPRLLRVYGHASQWSRTVGFAQLVDRLDTNHQINLIVLMC